jgi:hypothetical protein
MEDFFENIYRKKKPEEKKNNLIEKLYTPPKKEKGADAPHFQVLKPGYVHQADLIEMPNDEGYKYILTVADAYDRKADAVALKNKDAKTVLKGLKEIYEKNKILSVPHRFEVDAGKEFKGEVRGYLEENKVAIRVAVPGRHRQQAIVERRNQDIVRGLNKRMNAEELVTGETSRNWKDDLPLLIKVMNKHLPKVKLNFDNKWENQELLPLGTKVRVALDKPLDAEGNKRFGKFRTGDLRFDNNIRTINRVILKPGMPIMYLLDGPNGEDKVEFVARTNNQLQVVTKGEKFPKAKVVIKDVKKHDQFIVEEIVKERKHKGKKQVLVRWAGFDPEDDTWESYDEIKKFNPLLIKEYEASK